MTQKDTTIADDEILDLETELQQDISTATEAEEQVETDLEK